MTVVHLGKVLDYGDAIGISGTLTFNRVSQVCFQTFYFIWSSCLFELPYLFVCFPHEINK